MRAKYALIFSFNASFGSSQYQLENDHLISLYEEVKDSPTKIPGTSQIFGVVSESCVKL